MEIEKHRAVYCSWLDTKCNNKWRHIQLTRPMHFIDFDEDNIKTTLGLDRLTHKRNCSLLQDIEFEVLRKSGATPIDIGNITELNFDHSFRHVLVGYPSEKPRALVSRELSIEDKTANEVIFTLKKPSKLPIWNSKQVKLLQRFVESCSVVSCF